MIIWAIVWSIIGYVLGSILCGPMIAKGFGLGDLRAQGSGNIGATNVLRVGSRDDVETANNSGAGNAKKTGEGDGDRRWVGVTAALLTVVGDGGKSALAVFLASAALENVSGAEFIPFVSGFFAVIGHNYPIFFKFSGGKGVATTFGLLLAAVPPVGGIAILLWLLVALATRYSSLAALISIGFAPVGVMYFGFSSGYSYTIVLCLGFGLPVLAFWRHRANIGRLITGRETRIFKP